MKAVYVIDANLPFNVPVWRSEAFVFVLKINAAWDDEEISEIMQRKTISLS